MTKKKKPPIYRVMLHNDSFNRREYVVSVLLKVVDGLAMDEAVNVMQVSISIVGKNQTVHCIHLRWL